MTPYRWHERLEELLPKLEKFARTEGILVRYKRLLQASGHNCPELMGLSYGGHIELCSWLPLPDLVRTFCHELGHELLLPREQNLRDVIYREDPTACEIQAELVAYYVHTDLRLPYMGSVKFRIRYSASYKVAQKILNFVSLV